MARRKKRIITFDDEPLWYQDAIIYELHIRAFADSDADGVGDILGLIDKLDYLQDLGVTAIWLLPFYPSPLKDDGYDISDFTAIQPAYGDMRDFKTLVEEAHQHGLRVITELVLNHTSDQHLWFQRSRRSSPGTKWREFYVWSDTTDKYKDARIIFKDFESSNWTLDPVAKAYFWHRFYSYQPDLNYDNPQVQRAMLKVMDFWLKIGVDGLRVDAVPYLYEREGTNCENLPETHEYVKKLRKHIDSKYKNRMLLAEANQWPEDAVAYFGHGDEFHMAFHFPLMPRIFMALRMEDRFPIVDVLQETPSIPENCQWAIFLRNHDELTLEMVTDEERDYMYRVYAHDPIARLNLGIRRRLAPLLNNDRNRIELMNGLLFSLPGTPVIYYGDEIGMGDNFYLGDRNGVRTPMQWSPDRNAGFSQTNPQRLYLPIIIDPEYHYEAINVEAQQNNPSSLLWWMKRIIALRKRFKAFSRGTIEFLLPDNRSILAFLRRFEEEHILVVANLSHAAQYVELDLSQFDGRIPVELFGGSEFAHIHSSSYHLTLGPHSFYWFSLEPERIESTRPRASVQQAPKTLTTVTIKQKPEQLFEKKENWSLLERLLLNYARERRWFRGKARRIQSAAIRDVIPLPFTDSIAYFVLMEVQYTEGESETYVLPLMLTTDDKLAPIMSEYPHAIVARLKLKTEKAVQDTVLYEALVNKEFNSALLIAIGRRRRFKGINGRIKGSSTKAIRTICWPPELPLEPSPLKTEQTNTSVLYEDLLILKLFRQLEAGINPDLEIGCFLTENTDFSNIARVAGMLEYQSNKGHTMSLAILQEFVRNEGDAWEYTLDSLQRFIEIALAHPTVQVPPVPKRSILNLGEEVTPLAMETIGPYLASVSLLGQRTAELHLALASVEDATDFAPESFTLMYQNSIYHSMRRSAIRTMQLLRKQLDNIQDGIREKAEEVLEQEKEIIDHYQKLRGRRINAARIRSHGDYHLGQVLYTGKDFVIIDFEGEPARPLSERRLKRSPLRDVAGMIRSFHYATYMALLRTTQPTLRPEDAPILEQWARFWYMWVSSSFLNSYLTVVNGTGIVPQDKEELKILLNAYLLDKAIYEIGYELNNRPDWVQVPLRGILQLLEAQD
ncbi:MAG: maltose alpha-D-glucosyltransferase [Dehalococcoidia bacterium]|nr:MAG: maltose alpha-D-glucosyltransferase [Dehalococcoidia bacterium]